MKVILIELYYGLLGLLMFSTLFVFGLDIPGWISFVIMLFACYGIWIIWYIGLRAMFSKDEIRYAKTKKRS